MQQHCNNCVLFNKFATLLQYIKLRNNEINEKEYFYGNDGGSYHGRLQEG